ncbi:MAG: hypothetical protein CMJ78_15025 [Planctomycetaceae bacterium]|nr:hypothetical protein [Planctomycetaceae bacterium]
MISVALNLADNEIAKGVQFDGVYIHDVYSGDVIRKLPYSLEDAPHHSLDYSRDKSQLAGGGFASITIWNTKTGKVVKTLRPNSDKVVPDYTSVCFLADGKTLVSGDSVGRLTLWRLETGEASARAEVQDAGPVVDLDILDRRAVVVTNDGVLRIWDLDDLSEPQQTLNVTPKNGLIKKIQLGPTGRHVVTLNSNGTVYVLRLAM